MLYCLLHLQQVFNTISSLLFFLSFSIPNFLHLSLTALPEISYISAISSYHKPLSKCSIKSNLVTLCTYHHDQIHNNNIEIKGWVKTTDGLKLNYNIKDEL